MILTKLQKLPRSAQDAILVFMLVSTLGGSGALGRLLLAAAAESAPPTDAVQTVRLDAIDKSLAALVGKVDTIDASVNAQNSRLAAICSKVDAGCNTP